MPDMIVFVDNIRQSQIEGLVNILGRARASTMTQADEDVGWEVNLGWNWTTAKINLEIMQEAIAALGLFGFAVGANDNKILMGCSGGL
jgi:hypothetical protein